MKPVSVLLGDAGLQLIETEHRGHWRLSEDAHSSVRSPQFACGNVVGPTTGAANPLCDGHLLFVDVQQFLGPLRISRVNDGVCGLSFGDLTMVRTPFENRLEWLRRWLL